MKPQLRLLLVFILCMLPLPSQAAAESQNIYKLLTIVTSPAPFSEVPEETRLAAMEETKAKLLEDEFQKLNKLQQALFIARCFEETSARSDMFLFLFDKHVLLPCTRIQGTYTEKAIADPHSFVPPKGRPFRWTPIVQVIAYCVDDSKVRDRLVLSPSPTQEKYRIKVYKGIDGVGKIGTIAQHQAIERQVLEEHGSWTPAALAMGAALVAALPK